MKESETPQITPSVENRADNSRDREEVVDDDLYNLNMSNLNSTAKSKTKRIPAPVQTTVSRSSTDLISDKSVTLLPGSQSSVKFLTKQERAALALERRVAQVAASRAVAQSNALLSETRGSRPTVASETPSRSRLDQTQPKDFPPSAPSIQLAPGELDQMKKKYMGVKVERVRLRKMNEKKFNFDWDSREDTTRDDANPLYAQRHHAQFFGRGSLAGLDRQVQKQDSSFYQNYLSARMTSEDEQAAKHFEKEKQSREAHRSWEERHWSDKPLDAMKDRDWRILKEDFNISTKGGNIPHPLRSWSESTIPKKILQVIEDVGYKDPSPIQRQAIPIGLQNRDLIGIAETGSGKTASFVIPMLAFINDLPPLTSENENLGPYALILAPTRELAQQIESETSKFCRGMGYICVSIVGGHTIEEQAYSLRRGCHIIIATPGRLVDCLDRRILVLSQCTYVVMDEADRMLDMGFEADVNAILDSLPVSNVKPDTEGAENISALRQALGMKESYKFRQTVMFSATMPPAVERLARRYLRRPAVVTIGQAGQVVERIDQKVEFLSDEERKKQRLQEILSSTTYRPPIIIFVNLKKTCDSLSRMLENMDYRTAVLHGGKSQDQRESSLAALKAGTRDILIATDVAGRGIDVKNVSLVVNFDMAKSIEDYTHRIGRTGRAGQKGTAITFLTNADADVMYDLKNLLSKSKLAVIPPELARHEAAQTKPGGAIKRKHDEVLYLG